MCYMYMFISKTHIYIYIFDIYFSYTQNNYSEKFTSGYLYVTRLFFIKLKIQTPSPVKKNYRKCG